MAISFPLSIPSSCKPKRVQFYAVNAVNLSRSPFTFDTQVQEFSGQSWGAEVTFPPLEREAAEELVAFLLALQGPKGTFLLYDPLATEPRGIATGTPLVKGASQTGNSLVTDGWTPTTTGVLLRGDKFQIGTRLYGVMGTGDVDSDGSGDATIDIWPRLRESPADNEGLITERPKGLFRLANQMQNLWSADETRTYDCSFSCVEAI